MRDIGTLARMFNSQAATEHIAPGPRPQWRGAGMTDVPQASVWVWARLLDVPVISERNTWHISRLQRAARYSGLADHRLEGTDADLRVIRYGHGDRGIR